jgi:hypothetical protein
MAPLTSMLQVNHHVWLSVSTRRIPLPTLLAGTQRACGLSRRRIVIPCLQNPPIVSVSLPRSCEAGK